MDMCRALAYRLFQSKIALWMIGLLLPLQANAQSDLDARLKRVVHNSPIKLDNVTWCFLDGDGDNLSEHNAEFGMKPASTMKLLTTAAAFELLPENFQTKLWVSGTNETVLRWVGVGDPMIGDPGPREDNLVPSTLLAQLVKQIRIAGVTKVTRLEYDAHYFSGPRYHPNWPEEQFSKSYRCESAALNFAGNLVHVELQPRRSRPKLAYFPSEASQLITVREQFTDLQTTTKKDAVGFDRFRGRNEFRAFGVCRNRHTLKSPVHDPARWSAELLAAALRKSGIPVLQVSAANPDKPIPQERPILGATITTPLNRVIQYCNTTSRNLYAECLLKSVDRELGGTGSWLASGDDQKTAGQRMRDELSSLFADVISPADVIDDGSGLSHNNRLTARTLARLLDRAQSRPWHANWLQSLALARETGTLSNRFRSGVFDDCTIRGKSGYIRGASTLAGRLERDDDQHLSFAIMVKDMRSSSDAKRLHESLIAELIKYIPRRSEGDDSPEFDRYQMQEPKLESVSKAPSSAPESDHGTNVGKGNLHPGGSQSFRTNQAIVSRSFAMVIGTLFIVAGIRYR